MRCGWKAVVEMGACRAWCKKLEYGSMRESSLPSKLKTLTVWLPVPLFHLVSNYSAEKRGVDEEELTQQIQEDVHAYLLSAMFGLWC
jgi:hypothetical protein